MVVDIGEMLKPTGFAEGLTDNEIAALAPICKEKTFDQGEEIFGEASMGQELYIVCKGRVSLEVNLPNRPGNRAERLAVAQAGTVFGELSLVDGSPRSARARALNDSIVIEINSEQMRQLMEDYPRIGYVVMRNLATYMCSRLRDTNLWLRNELLWSR